MTAIGDAAPGFSLPDTNGQTHEPGGTATVVVFTCNHCPYALAWHERVVAVARAYGATHTPDVFVLDADLRLRYRGAPDADYEDPSQNASHLRDALDAVFAGATPDPASTQPVGCTIKWSG